MKENEKKTAEKKLTILDFILDQLLGKGFAKKKEEPQSKEAEKPLQTSNTTNIIINVYYNPEKKDFFQRVSERLFKNKK